MLPSIRCLHILQRTNILSSGALCAETIVQKKNFSPANKEIKKPNKWNKLNKEIFGFGKYEIQPNLNSTVNLLGTFNCEKLQLQRFGFRLLGRSPFVLLYILCFCVPMLFKEEIKVGMIVILYYVYINIKDFLEYFPKV